MCATFVAGSSEVAPYSHLSAWPTAPGRSSRRASDRVQDRLVANKKLRIRSTRAAAVPAFVSKRFGGDRVLRHSSVGVFEEQLIVRQDLA
jgi:hypothetical protein